MSLDTERIDKIITAWLDAKMSISGSLWTRQNYGDTLKRFRSWLHARALELDLEDTAQLATQLERWSVQGNPTAHTINSRVAIISSFYRFARKRRLLTINNPAELLERVSVQMYAESRALDIKELHAKLAVIDRTTLQGKRDFALLMVALQTGRRRGELAQLRMGDLEIGKERITIIWRRCKGGKKMLDTLPGVILPPLLDYLQAVYGSSPSNVPPESPVWVRLRSVEHGRQPITGSSISRICEHRLNTSNAHRLRHTFAKAMEMVGAKLSDIQARLGHNSLATTGIYLAALSRDENPNADALAALFGFGDATLMSGPAPVERFCVECKQPLDAVQREDKRRLYCSPRCSRAAQNRKMVERAAQNTDACPRLHKRRLAKNRVVKRSVVSAQQLSLWSQIQLE